MSNAAYHAKWQAANLDKRRAAQRANYTKHHAKRMARLKAYRLANREKIRAYDRLHYAKWRAANLDKRRAAQRRHSANYATKHRTKRLERLKVYRLANKEKIRAYNRLHRAQRLLNSRRSRQRHIESARERARVRARRRAAVGNIANNRWRLLNPEAARDSGRRSKKNKRLEAAYCKLHKLFEKAPKEKTMHNDKMIRFIKQWRDLETQRRKLDFERSRWCRNVRAEFAKGAVGDRAFMNWLAVELGITASIGQELLERAVASQTVQDESTWDRVGGFSHIRVLAPLPQRDKITVLEAAKADAKTVKTVMRERGLILPKKMEKPDVVILAEFIATLDKVPPGIMAVVGKYVSKRAIRQAASQKMAA